jgi:hypothetical protein
MKKRHISIILLLSIAVLMFSCKKEKSEWQGTIEEVEGVTYVNNPKEGLWDSKEESQITLIEDLKIGEMDGPEEILFVYLRDVAVNTKGDIYMADLKLNEIRKFNKDGEYLMTLGRPGQGPGEFQFLRILSVNSEDDLIVFDGICRVSIFTDSGELLTTTKKLVPDSWIDASKIFATAGKYVIFGKLTNSLKLFHEFDKNWDLTDSYIEYVFIDNKEFEEQTLVFQPGYCVFLNNGEIIYTNFLYNNQIYFYRNRELTTIISKESDINKPYVVEYFNDMEKTKKVAKDKGYYFNQFGPGGYFTGNYIQRSLGVYQLSDGNIVNFLNIRKTKDIYEYGVELYDSSGKFLTYSKLGDNLGYDVRCKDSDDLFYAIDRREYHKVIRFRLEY